MLKRCRGIHITLDGGGVVKDWVAVEGRYELFLNDRLLDTMVVTPKDLKAHAIGYLVTEGIISPGEVVEIEETKGRVFVKTAGKMGKTACRGVWRDAAYRGGMEEGVEAVISPAVVAPELVVRCAAKINEKASGWKKSGGLHISLLFDIRGKLLKVAEDIGRHNTIDKVVGYALLQKVPLDNTILTCSGRQPEGMVTKAARAGIPIVITKAAVTDRGIEVAKKLGVTLIGFARGGAFTIYAHPERVVSRGR